MTLLHNLIWYNRPDLAQLLLENPNFTKINFKFCIPFGMKNMYASALDLAIAQWFEKNVSLDFIETLLKYGALVPKVDKKFLSEELLSYFFPAIVNANNKSEDSPSTQEIINLLCLLNRYEFPIKELEDNFRVRLFGQGHYDNCSQEFQEKFSISSDNQKMILDQFFGKLESEIKDNKKGERLVEMNDARLNNGESTLSLPPAMLDPPCNVF